MMEKWASAGPADDAFAGQFFETPHRQHHVQVLLAKPRGTTLATPGG
jgi:hypothetical protein